MIKALFITLHDDSGMNSCGFSYIIFIVQVLLSSVSMFFPQHIVCMCLLCYGGYFTAQVPVYVLVAKTIIIATNKVKVGKGW